MFATPAGGSKSVLPWNGEQRVMRTEAASVPFLLSKYP